MYMYEKIFSTLFVLDPYWESFFFSAKNKSKDLYGQWRLHIDIQEAIKVASDDYSFIENIMISGISEMITSIINEVRITFNFQKNNELILTIVTPIEDTTTKVENLKWNLNSKKNNSSLKILTITKLSFKMRIFGYWKMAFWSSLISKVIFRNIFTWWENRLER